MVIGFLRFVGIMNAAIWLGGAVFFTFGAGPAVFSDNMRALLGANNFPYFSGAIAGIILKRYFYFHLICNVVALLHLFAERLYLGRTSSKSSLGLLVGTLTLIIIGGGFMQPRLRQLHDRAHAVNAQSVVREAAARWHTVAQVANLLVIGGIIVYVWRVNNPADTTRFVSPFQKFGS